MLNVDIIYDNNETLQPVKQLTAEEFMKNKTTRTDGIKEALQLYEKPLIRFAMQYASSQQLAQDIVQDCFLKLCKADWDKVAQNVRPWLYKVCRNRALEIIRKESRMSEFDDIRLEQTTDSALPPDMAVERRDSFRQAMSLMTKLPTKEQEVLKLKYQQSLTYKEISEVTGLTVTNIGFILHTALKELRNKINLQEVTR